MNELNDIIHRIGVANRLSGIFIQESLSKNGIKDLAPSHGDILFLLFENDKMKMKEIAARINRDKSTVTALINKLKLLDYIKSTSSKEDKRVTFVELTAKGKKLKKTFFDISFSLNDKAFEGFSEKEISTFSSLIDKMIENFNKK